MGIQENKALKIIVSTLGIFIGIVVVFAATHIALFQSFPGVDPTQAIFISMIILVFGICIFIVTIFAGFMYDIERENIEKAI